MNTPCRFIIIDSDEANSFVSCKAIMLAARETTIQTFTDPDKGLEYIKNRSDDLKKNKTMLFVNAEFPEMKTFHFIEEFHKISDIERNKMSVYLLGSHPDLNIKDLAAKFPFLKGFVKTPLSRQSVSECIISV